MKAPIPAPPGFHFRPFIPETAQNAGEFLPRAQNLLLSFWEWCSATYSTPGRRASHRENQPEEIGSPSPQSGFAVMAMRRPVVIEK